MSQLEIFLFVAKTLNRLEIPYMLTGAFAVSFYGKPRTTHDIDLKIIIPITSVNSLCEALKGYFYIDEESIKEAIAHKDMFNIIHIDTSIKIDFWLVKDEPFDKERFKRKTKVLIRDIPVFISTAEDLILIKLVWYKKSNIQRHIEDTTGILEVQQNKLDIEYIKKWVDYLSVKDIFQEISKQDF